MGNDSAVWERGGGGGGRPILATNGSGYRYSRHTCRNSKLLTSVIYGKALVHELESVSDRHGCFTLVVCVKKRVISKQIRDVMAHKQSKPYNPAFLTSADLTRP